MAREKQAATDGDTVEYSPGYSCPFCNRTVPAPDDIYRHLMVNHRKSELSREIIELLDTETRAMDELADKSETATTNR